MTAFRPVLRGMALLFVSLATCGSALAGAWDSAHIFDSPDKTVKTVVITGNFVKPRIIAEMARKETRTPYLLLPAPGDSRIFFCPAGKGPALEIRETDLGRFIEFIKPKQLVVLGDYRFVPQYYLTAIGTGYDTVAIDSDNWYTNATTLGNLLNFKELPERYTDAINKLESGKWDLVPRPDAKVQKQTGLVQQGSSSTVEPEARQAQIDNGDGSASPITMMIPQNDEPVLLVPQDAKKPAK